MTSSPGETAVETPVESETAVKVMKVMEAAKRKYSAPKEARPSPVVARVAIVGVSVPGIPVSIINRRVLYRIAKRVHALRVSDIVACLQIEFAGRRIVCTDRCTTHQAGRSANRRTGRRISGRGADCRARRRANNRTDGSASDCSLSARLPWLDIADRCRSIVTTLLVILLEDRETLSRRGKRHHRGAGGRRHGTCRKSTQAGEGTDRSQAMAYDTHYHRSRPLTHMDANEWW